VGVGGAGVADNEESAKGGCEMDIQENAEQESGTICACSVVLAGDSGA